MSSEPKRPRLQRIPVNIEAVLPDDLRRPVALTGARVGVIADRKHTSRLIRQLNDVHPIPALQHLKRVRGAHIILASVEDHASGEACLEDLSSRGLDKSGLAEKIETLMVPAEAPRTRVQFDEANRSWSCNFHENHDLEKLLSGEMFSEEEVNEHRSWMNKALDAADVARTEGSEAVGAVIVDPARKAIVASARDSRNAHPLQHAAMNVVDLVARSQRGGVWPPRSGDYFDDNIPDKPPPVGTNRNREAPDTDKPIGPYLCTGYDVYLTREPCTMCAMALVHSRIRTVFYSTPSDNGILGTRTKLHAVKALNHHYQVFRGLLSDS